MRIRIPEPPKLIPVGRDIDAPWLKKGSNKWRLAEDFIVFVDDRRFVVPAGYPTDLSSIPRWFWWLWPAGHTGARTAAIWHDRAYSHWWGMISKDYADRVFKAIMEHRGAGKCTVRVFYLAVRLGGRGGW